MQFRRAIEHEKSNLRGIGDAVAGQSVSQLLLVCTWQIAVVTESRFG